MRQESMSKNSGMEIIMKKNPLSFSNPNKHPVESYVNVQLPESTWRLFHAVFDHELLSQEEKDRINAQTAQSLSVNAQMYPAPAEYSDQGAPRGTFASGMLSPSAFYPDSPHPYWLYIPAAYDPDVPANLAVFLDGPMYTLDSRTREPIPYPDTLFVLDNLISEKKIPPTIAVFLSFGLKGPGQPLMGFNEGEVNRSLEYDTPSDWHSRFLTEEALPEILASCSVSDQPADHAIIGISSSGIAAFTAAWFQPGFFGNVIAASPSFANIRGGIVWPSVIRVCDPKPVRLFAAVGKYDLDHPFGSWLAGNLDVEKALRFKGYDYRYYLSEAGHSGQVNRYILPQGLQWAFTGREASFENLTQIS